MLFVARAMPWPLHGGARIRDYNKLQALASLFDVDLLTVGRPEPRIARLCRNVILPTPYYGDESVLLALQRWGGACWASLGSREPLWLTSKTNNMLRRAMRKAASSGKYDVVHASELSSVATLLGHTSCPLVYDAHNAEWRLLDSTSKQLKGLRRAILDIEVPKLRDIERRSVTEPRMVLVTAPTDQAELQDLGGAQAAPMRVIPSAIDLSLYQSARDQTPDPGTILIPGKFDWRPNLIGLEWFIDDVLPLLRHRMEGTTFHVIVAGRLTDSTVAKAQVAGIEVAQNPDEMQPYFARAGIVAVPVLVSSGTRLRMAEAMACRRAIVATTPGALGLDPGAEQAWLTADGTEDYASALERVLRDETLRRELADAGWRRAQDLHWKAVVPALAEAYGTALGRELVPS